MSINKRECEPVIREYGGICVVCPFCNKASTNVDVRTLHLESDHELSNFLADPSWAEGNKAYLKASMRHPEKDDLLNRSMIT
jgi:hypothetical protein